MKKIALPFVAMVGILFLANWGTPENNTDEGKKDGICFYGLLETWQGQVYEVENISIDYKIKKIPLYEKPLTMKSSAQEHLSTAEPHVLTQNPLKSFVLAKENLSTIQSLEIPEPEHPWVFYKKRKGDSKRDAQRLEFLEIIVTFRGAPETKTSYLIESHKKLYCTRVVGSSKERREVPLVAMKKLTLLGCRQDIHDTQELRCTPASEHPITNPATLPVA